jgi:hypothetical protein
MSDENVDLVRSIHADWGQGDYASTKWVDPEIEWVIVDGPSPGRWVGAAGMEAVWRDFLSAWKGFRSEVEEYRELDEERVLVLHHWS